MNAIVKIFALLCVLLAATVSHAGGKLTYEAVVTPTQQLTNQKIGIAISQEVVKGISFESWTGGGFGYDITKPAEFITAKNALMLNIGRLSVGGGIQLGSEKGTSLIDKQAFVKASIQLW